MTNVQDCKSLYFCDKLEHLDLRDNFIEGLNEQVMPLLQTMQRLRTLDLRDNKVQLEARYREQMIMEGRSLAELDGKTIRDQDRRYLYALAQQMSKKRLNRSASLQSSEKRRSNSHKGFFSTNQQSQFG